MINGSPLLSMTVAFGFLGGVSGLLVVLAWLEPPAAPSWRRRQMTRSADRGVDPGDRDAPAAGDATAATRSRKA